MLGSAASHKIVVNGKHITNMWSGGYYPYCVTPGEVVMAMDLRSTAGVVIAGAIEGERERLRFNAKKGGTYYVEFRFGKKGVGSPTMVLVDISIGAKEIQHCKLTQKIESSACLKENELS